MKILLAVDGSKNSERAARHVVQLAGKLAGPPRVTVLHVDPPLLQAAAARLGARAVAEYHADNADYALRHVRRVLRDAKFAHEERTAVGEAAITIASTAEAHGADLVVMGSRGMSPLKNFMLGSVSAKVLAQSKVPVTLVR